MSNLEGHFDNVTDGEEKEISIDVESTDEEKNLSPTSDFSKAPDSGLEAWLVAIGAASIFFSTLGYVNAFGVFQEYYLTHQLHDHSPDDIAWIGSLAAFFQFAAGAIGGPLFDRYGAWVMRPAAVLYVFALMMTSLCHEYWQFMLAQGCLIGISIGLLQFPAMAAVAQYFDKKRAAALGVAISGSSIGGVVLPIAVSQLLNKSSVGFGWSLRIIGFILLPFLAFSCFVVKSRLPPRRTNFFIGSAFKETRFIFLIIAFSFMILGVFTPIFFIPSYAVTKGIDASFSAYLLAIINAASTFGRIVPGILADKFGRLNIFAIAGIVSGIITFCLTKAETTVALVVYSLAIGFSTGAIISGGSAAFSLCPKDPRDMGTYLGMGIGVSSIAALIGPPINGALIHSYGGFLQVSIFSGVMCLAGGCMAILTKTATPQGVLGRI